MNQRFLSLAFTALAIWLGAMLYQDAYAATNEQRPACSPDGSRMVYMLQSERTKYDWELYQLEFSSQRRKRLTAHEGRDGYAVWSPDSKKIIFDREHQSDGRNQPWIMDLENFTSHALGNFEGWLSISDWSADRHLLGFYQLAGQRDLVLLGIDGHMLEKITSTPGQDEHDAHFSPDGTQIAYANRVINGTRTSLEILDLGNHSTTTIRTSPGTINGLSWSFDGQRIAFADSPGGDDDNADIFIYNVGLQSFQQVTDNPARDHSPRFCGNNHTLLFTSDRSGEERIYQLDPDPGAYLQVERVQK